MIKLPYGVDINNDRIDAGKLNYPLLNLSNQDATDLNFLTRFECVNQREEAGIISLIIRETIDLEEDDIIFEFDNSFFCISKSAHPIVLVEISKPKTLGVFPILFII